MEHFNYKELIKNSGIDISLEQIEKLYQFSTFLYEESKLYNLTGHNSHLEIFNNLIVNSITPLKNINVPRGTLITDLGTGAGIPGIPLSMLFPAAHFTLIESNSKKINFIEKAIRKLKISNISTENQRVEEYAKLSDNIETQDIIVSRGMGEIYYTIEMASSLIKTGGLLYIYSNIPENHLSNELKSHIGILGLSAVKPEDYLSYSFSEEGLLFKKDSPTPEKYPRRIAVIKRESKKIKN